MNLLETYNLLNEIYETQLKYLEDTDRYYHFFNDFSDMTSALYSGIIYSSFNGSDSQLDAGSKRFGDVGYTCMLKGEYGKKRIVTAINHERPFGVSFKDLPALCEQSGYIFDADGFNQVLNKMSFDSKGKYLSPKEKITLRDFRILSIGKLADGRYFVTGGQGRGLKDVQRSTFFTDHELYKICKDWFLANMNNPGTSHYWYWFKDDTTGVPTLVRDIPDFGKCVLNTSGNLNSKYVPYESKNYGNTPAIRFDGPKFIHNVKFDEIIGIGPTKVFDEDSNEILLQIPLVDPSSKGGYSVPELFGKDLTSGSYPETTSIRPAARTTLTTKQNLYMSEKDAKKLTALFDEGEYRVYSQSKRNFKFQPSDIATIALPSSVKLDSGKGPTIDLRTLVKLIIDNKNISDGDIISALHKYGCVNETGRLSAVSEKALRIFIELMTEPYKDVGIEWIDIGKGDYVAASSQINIKDSPKDLLKLKSHQRALISAVPDMSKSEVLTYNGISTVIAPLNIEDTEVMARCGAEVIIVGKTDSGQKVVLFVKNPKSPKFLELPGGGLYHKSDTYDGIVKQRIKFKTGLDLSDISNISDTGKGIILNEEKTAKDKNLKSICSYSYYRLFTAEYVNEIPDADVAGYSYDNRQMAADMKIAGESGYTAYLTWVPVNLLDMQPNIIDRYSCILPLITSVADKLK